MGLTYYVNPVTGADANDGLTPATAWRTAAKINTASSDGTIVAAPSYATGSRLIIDTSSAPLDVTAGALEFRTRGLTVIGAGADGRFNLQTAKRIMGGEWTFLASGVYTTTNTTANCVLWEDSKWMNHPVGTTYASVQASMQSTPGSFWTDGTTLYCHPFGNTDPRSDGKVYQRSCFGSTGPAVFLSASDMDFCGAVISMTCDVQNDGQSQGGYGIQGGGLGGISRVRKCMVTYGGKHGIGFTYDASNSDLTIEDCQVEQCSPYSDQSCWVSYMADPTGVLSGNIHRYVRCTTNKVAGLIGSTAGADATIACFYCHNNGVGSQFYRFEFIDCNFLHGSLFAALAPVVTITGGIIGNVQCYSPTINIDRVKFNGRGVMGINGLSPTPSVRVTNCLIQPTEPFAGGGNEGWYIWGNVTIEGCTFDLRQIPAGTDWPYAIIWIPDQTVPTPRPVFTFINNIVLSDGRYGIFRYGFDTDNLSIHHNAYFGMGRIAIFYNPGTAQQANYDTLAQWQAATAHDDNTIYPVDLMLDASFKPLAGSPVIDKGSDLGIMADYTGLLFSPRNDIGAYEFGPSWVPPAPAGEGVKAGAGVYNLLQVIATNTAGTSPKFADGMHALAYKIAQNTAGTSPKFGEGIYDLFYKIAQNTAGTSPRPGDRFYDLLYKTAGNTGSNKPSFGDGTYELLRKIAINTTKP
jgi:hypothetical protein